ncbi:MAG: rhomboid family intramembrane serine protease [Candidatus Thermoplasmatota archaeon]|jgi:hypothetical protein|nr:rhomboid family intramembrane serine protease [Candidatus Thermoplasmatota archaeon]MDP7264688.1 rhomboid family intramembrane serine protease [Candidatus Thermoplasmatota archaeon]
MNIKKATLTLIVINVIAFLVQEFSQGAFTKEFLLVSADVLIRPWTLITSMFLHGSLSHLVFNMVALFVFGPLVEKRVGKKRFLILYVTGGLLAGIGASFFYPAALGASGAIMGIAGMAIVLYPTKKILFYMVIPMPLWMLGILYIAVDTFGIFFPSGTANIAHLIGLAIGLAYGFYLRKTKEKHKYSKKFREFGIN